LQKGKASPIQGAAGQQGQKPEDNKDSPEYKKKLAIAAGPVLTMDYENSKSYGMTESLFTCLKDIFEAVIAHRSRIGVVSPHKFLETLRRDNEMFRTPMHQDAHEFLNLLLNEVVENVEKFSKQLQKDNDRPRSGFDEALSPVVRATMPDAILKNSLHTSRWVHELFEGTLTSETRCLTCENTSQRDEAFLDLSVDLEQHTSVTACLRKFSEEEMLCERNKFHCDKCGGLQEAEKRMKVKRLPRILALHLKRFKYTEDLQRLQKLFHRVVYPYYLRLFNTTDDAEDPDRLYELYAVVVHIGGGPYHGHYVSIIKTQDRGWLLFDDEMVEPVDKAYVRNFFGGEGNLACAYVLFYQETTLEAMQKEQEAEGSADKTTAQATEPLKDGSLAAAKQTGNVNGAIYAHTPATPPLEEADHFANLDQSITAPLLPTMPSPIPPTSGATSSEQTPASTPASPQFPFASKRKSAINLREDRRREEKERRAAEKVAKAAEKEEEKRKAKERLAQTKEYHRLQEEELKAAIAASKISKTEEDKKGGGTAVVGAAAAWTEKPVVLPAKENGNVGGFNRFRHTSMSFRGHRPKFWSTKDKEKEREKEKEVMDEGDGHVPTELADQVPASDEPAATSTFEKQEEKREKLEKSKSRFSLRRKRSHP
jgi:ubiquitin carboxyl-terminal hydrolase 9/13